MKLAADSDRGGVWHKVKEFIESRHQQHCPEQALRRKTGYGFEKG